MPISLLIGILVFLLLLSAFFSGSETALMSLNRYKLKHLAQQGHRGAQRAEALLATPDRLIGLILLGNNFVNISASAMATVVGMRLFGNAGIAIATGVLTLLVLIFAEVAPKTMAALHPERIAFPAAWFYSGLLRVLYPLVWVVNLMANAVLALFGVSVKNNKRDTLSREELRTVVAEAGAMMPKRQKMLLSIMDLENVTVEDIMVPRSEIRGININQNLPEIIEQLRNSQHTKLPLYRDSIDHIIGWLHLRRLLPMLSQPGFSKQSLINVSREPYFIPEATALSTQLLAFQSQHRRIGLVVDEYGDIQGLVALEDILEEIIGEFTTDPASQSRHVSAQPDGSYLVAGSANIRTLNRDMDWSLPTDGPKTLNGLILESMQSIPVPGVCLQMGSYGVEIMEASRNTVINVKLTVSQNS